MIFVKAIRSNLQTAVFIVLTLLYLAPIWVFTYFPSQDGPSHVYNSFILRHYKDPQYHFNRYYDLRTELIPNWTAHAVMASLMYFVSPPITEKIFLTGYVVAMALSLLYLATAKGPNSFPLVFLGFPFIYSYPLMMGFYSFAFGVVIFLFVAGYCARHSNDLGIRGLLSLALLLLLLYFCNPIPLAFCIAAIVMIQLFQGHAKGKTIKRLAAVLLVSLPVVTLLVHFVMTGGAVDNVKSVDPWTTTRLLQYFLLGVPIAFHSQSQIVFGALLSAIFWVLLGRTFARERSRLSQLWRGILPIDCFLALAILYLAIYMMASDHIAGGGFIKTRLAVFPFLIVIPWLDFNLRLRAKRILSFTLVALSTVWLIHFTYYDKVLNDTLSIYNSATDVIERNSVLLPLNFDNNDHSWLIGVLANAPSYYGYKNGCINLMNYEAETTHFPTVFKRGLQRPPVVEIFVRQGELDPGLYRDTIDYVITWALPPGSVVEERIERFYKLVRENGRLKIFKRTMTAPEAFQAKTVD